ncbi:stage II sporulation protein D [Paenibacillus sp. PAMC21692]|nr:stage II sporulation protein D [Paenibacillus sp. PAMC21692]
MAEKPGTHAGAVPVVESEDRGKQPTDREAGSPGMVSKGATGDVSPPETSQQAPEDVTSVGKSPKQAEPAVKGALEGVTVRVYLTGTGTVEKVPIETYVMGVLAGEMPIDFELEALKAQAIAARTYIVRRLASGDNELASRGADVSDTVEHQVYVSKKELGRRWEGEAEAENLAKLAQAVRETEGLVVTYEGEPIQAAFFSTSNGYTENSEEYWTMSLPYLRSVDSPWDKSISPRYEQEETFELSRFYKLMGMKGKKAKGKPSIKLVDKTEGNRIKSISVNGTAFTGREVRERLGLASSQFSWKIGKEGITFTTYGFGHGVGMSQWGANGMAKEGRTAVDILLHYYSGTKVEQASNLP